MKPWLNDSLAANGRPVQDNFRDWFGSSKIVDDDGNPMVLYHGSSSNFHVFRPGCDGAGWFAQSPELASVFAREGGGGRGDVVYPVFLSIENPLDCRTEEGLVIMRDAHKQNPGLTTAKQLEILGYDGLISDEYDNGCTTFLAFRPDQIKSATGNCGLYVRGSVELTDQVQLQKILQAQAARAVIATLHSKVEP